MIESKLKAKNYNRGQPYLLKVLEKLNFGTYFLQWIKTFYTDISSCVLNNGFTTDLFQVRRGVRQGDPLSPLLFILAIEILATQIRQDDNIHGVMVKNEEIKLTLFADDMTCFLNDINSYLQLCRLLEDFYKYSGLRINNDKTELFAIGSIKLAQHDFIHNVRTSIKILGTFLTTINRHGTKQILNQFSSPFKGPWICGSVEALLYLERFK